MKYQKVYKHKYKLGLFKKKKRLNVGYSVAIELSG